MQLADAERLILLNLFEIRQALDREDREHWEMCADIVRRGYEGLYHKLPPLEAPMPREQSEFVRDIADVFIALGDYVRDNPEDTEVRDHPNVHFAGFDANADSRLLGFLRFIMDKCGEAEALTAARKRARDFNTHGGGPSREEYQAMVTAWKASKKAYPLTAASARAILGAKPALP